MPGSAYAALWLSSSDEGKTVLYAIVGFILGIAMFIRGFRMLQRKRLIMNTPLSHVRSAAIGLVELSGQAVGPHTLVSPITQRPCFYYRTALWREVGSGKDRRWEQAADERFHLPFYLKDPTGMVLVDPNGAELDIHCDFKGEYNHSMFSGSGVPPRVAEFADRNGCSISSNIRVEEYCLKPQNAVYILGTLATNTGLECTPAPQSTLRPNVDITQIGTGGPGAGFTGAVLGLLNLNFNVSVQRSRPTFSPAPLTATDLRLAEGRAARAAAAGAAGAADASRTQGHPQPANEQRAAAALSTLAARDAVLAAQAATFLGTSLAQAIGATVQGASAPPTSPQPASQASGPGSVAATAEPESFPDKNPTVIRQGTNDRTFYISWRSQKEIVSDLATKSFLLIFGGPALSAACLWYLLAYFKMT